MRRYDEPIAVRTSGAAGEPDAPAHFIWRSRLWRVLDVHSVWVEASPWWRKEPPDPLDEQQVWRVEAAVSAAGSRGVYDLACRGQQWVLRSVVD